LIVVTGITGVSLSFVQPVVLSVAVEVTLGKGDSVVVDATLMLFVTLITSHDNLS